MNFRKFLCGILAFAIFASIVPIAHADAASIVINEVAWAGSLDSSNDEWIELYNTSDQNVDVSGWELLDDGVSIHTFENTVIPSHSYYLIEDTEDTVSNVDADLVLGLSLANTGDSLELLNANGTSVDIVNSAGEDYPAGDNVSKATMERISATSNGDDSDNWADSVQGNGALASDGSEILGTPKGLNSVSEAPNDMPTVSISLPDGELQVGDVVTLTVNVSNVTDLVAYEVDMTYNGNALDYLSAEKGTFLSENGVFGTVFQSGLENGQEGKAVFAEARLATNNGVSGDGEMFKVDFQIAGNTDIAFGPESFLANADQDINALLEGVRVDVDLEMPTQVLNLQASLSEERYSSHLTWDLPESGADHYKILRRAASGEFVEIGTSNDLNFIDNENIVPQNEYIYRILTVVGGDESDPSEITFTETRGIKGDNNRSDRVDGRDLQRLAAIYTKAINDDGFDHLVDTTYDGVIDGNDLIDIGANWAVTYE